MREKLARIAHSGKKKEIVHKRLDPGLLKRLVCEISSWFIAHVSPSTHIDKE